jgi:redox-sensitive bicupin YhaK (pirin superfamily)
MSAGTGVLHSEYNLGTELLRFLQIWILPAKKGYKPNYGEYRFNIEDRRDKWLPLVSGVDAASSAPVRIHQDVNVYAAIISAGKSLTLEVAEGRQAYLVLIEGSAKISGNGSNSTANLAERDAAEITGEGITINAKEPAGAHVLVIEMAQG